MIILRWKPVILVLDMIIVDQQSITLLHSVPVHYSVASWKSDQRLWCDRTTRSRVRSSDRINGCAIAMSTRSFTVMENTRETRSEYVVSIREAFDWAGGVASTHWVFGSTGSATGTFATSRIHNRDICTPVVSWSSRGTCVSGPSIFRVEGTHVSDASGVLLM